MTPAQKERGMSRIEEIVDEEMERINGLWNVEMLDRAGKAVATRAVKEFAQVLYSNQFDGVVSTQTIERKLEQFGVEP